MFEEQQKEERLRSKNNEMITNGVYHISDDNRNTDGNDIDNGDNSSVSTATAYTNNNNNNNNNNSESNIYTREYNIAMKSYQNERVVDIEFEPTRDRERERESVIKRDLRSYPPPRGHSVYSSENGGAGSQIQNELVQLGQNVQQSIESLINRDASYSDGDNDPRISLMSSSKARVDCKERWTQRCILAFVAIVC